MVGHTKQYVSCQSIDQNFSLSLRTKQKNNNFKNTHVIQQTVFIITKEHLAGMQRTVNSTLLAAKRDKREADM